MSNQRQLTAEEKRLWEAVVRRDQKRRKKHEKIAEEKVPPVMIENFTDLLAQVDAEKAALPVPSTKPKKQETPVASPPLIAVTKLKTKTPALPLPVLSWREARARFRLHQRIDGRIDLHGLTQDEAFALLRGFILGKQASGKRHLAIITGKGKSTGGILRIAVPHWLELPEFRDFIGTLAYAPPEKGGEGVLHVLLKKR